MKMDKTHISDCQRLLRLMGMPVIEAPSEVRTLWRPRWRGRGLSELNRSWMAQPPSSFFFSSIPGRGAVRGSGQGRPRLRRRV